MKEDKHKMTEQSLPFDFFADESDPVEQSATEPAETDASQAAADKTSVMEQQLPLLFDELSVAVGDEVTASKQTVSSMEEAAADDVVGEKEEAVDGSSVESDENGDKPRRTKFRGRPMARRREELPKTVPSYLSKLNPAKAEELAGRIFQMVVVEKGYLDKNISARELVKRLGTNTRYFSITMNRRFHCNFATFLNKLRVEEAMTRMADARFDDVSLQDLAGMVGFASRQSFINAFQKVQGVTPSEYRATVR